ncbi:MAG TPA: nucleoid occlusion protein [Syntrophomonadaceae bacterium]|nr:nucleoid occlusion protein [Syntrophomonadaceae bacterium]
MVRKQLGKLWGKNQGARVVNIPLDRITFNPYQPRKYFEERELLELAKSIQSYGIIQPIVVRENGDYYQIIAGERRYRACELIGIKDIPALVQEMDDEKAAAVSLIENLQRKELNYFEEASAYNLLINVFGFTQEELANKIGKSQSAIANKLRLLKLSPAIRAEISPAQVTERHARALLKLNNPDLQLSVIEEIAKKELTVKETEELVEKLIYNRIPMEEVKKEAGQNISMIIRDVRIFLNTIKETVKRAKQTGIDISMTENDSEDNYEIIIRIAKNKKPIRKIK